MNPYDYYSQMYMDPYQSVMGHFFNQDNYYNNGNYDFAGYQQPSYMNQSYMNNYTSPLQSMFSNSNPQFSQPSQMNNMNMASPSQSAGNVRKSMSNSLRSNMMNYMNPSVKNMGLAQNKLPNIQ